MEQNKHQEEEAEMINKTDAEASEEISDAAEAAAEQGDSGPPAEKSAEDYEKEIEELRKQCEDNYNKLLRMQADFDNYRKRVAKEREEMYSSALEEIVADLLPVVDNMERAVEAFKNDKLDDKYVSGVEMVFRQFMDVLARKGVKEIEALDKDFDPNIHHAVMQVPVEDENDENKVKEVFQKGYMLGNKVIRPTLVKVSVKQ